MKITICDRCGEVFIDKGTRDTITIEYENFDLCKGCQMAIISEMISRRIEKYREKLETKIKEASNDK